MLNKSEREVLTAIIDKCRGSESCIVSVDEICSVLNKKLTKGKVQTIISSLEYDDYLDYVNTLKGEKKLLSVRLHKKAKTVNRELKNFRRTLWLKLALAAASALVTFLLSRLLFYIFS